MGDKMKKYDVQCPHCCGTFHETTIHYRLGVPVKGHMLTSKQHVKDAAWSTFPEYDSTEYQDIICPSCSQAYLDSLGMVIRLVDKGETLPDPPSESENMKAAMDRLMAEYEPELPEVSSQNWDYANTLSETHTFDMVRSKFAETMQQSESMISVINASISAINPPTPKKKPGRPKK